MKVISGSLKGRVIKGYRIEGTRPTMDRVKESVFASIQSYLEDSLVLDLFAGSGNLGIEAISNGASKCYFVDYNRECIKVIHENMKQFGIEKQGVVLEMDYYKALEYFRDHRILFDIIFVDPPYRSMVLEEVLDKVYEYGILSQDGLIVLEYQNETIEQIPVGYQCLRHKKYGDKYVTIYQLKEVLD